MLVASLSHRPSLFIQLHVVMKEGKQKRFSTNDLSSIRCQQRKTWEQADPTNPISICLKSYVAAILINQMRWEYRPLPYDAPLKSLMGRVFFLKCNSLAPHIARVIKCRNHQPFFNETCKLFLAVALTASSDPQSLPSVQF